MPAFDELDERQQKRRAVLAALGADAPEFAQFLNRSGEIDTDAVGAAPDQDLAQAFLKTRGYRRQPGGGMAREAPLRVRPVMSMDELPSADTAVDEALATLSRGGQLPRRQLRMPEEAIQATDPWAERKALAKAPFAPAPFPDRSEATDEELNAAFPRKRVRAQTLAAINPRDVLRRARGEAPLKMEAMDIEAKVPPAETLAMEPMDIEGRLPRRPAPGPSNRPDAVATRAVMAAAPQPTAADPEMDALRKSRDRDLGLAALATNFGRGADTIQGTRSPDAGAAIRASADTPIEDLMANRARQKEATAAATAAEQRQFDRSQALAAEKRALAGEARAQTTFEGGQALRDPKSRQSKAARDQAAALYPKEWSSIPAADRAQMSAEDTKIFFQEMSRKDELRRGRGAGAGSGRKPMTSSQLSKLVPPDTLNIYESLQKAQGAVSRIGGWDKAHVGGVRGLIAGATGGAFEGRDQQDLMQNLGAAASMALSARGGKAITNEEERVILGRIRANPFDPRLSPDVIQRAFSIIERYTRNNLRQALAGASPEDRAQVLDYMGVPEEWAKGEPGTAVVGGAAQPQKMVKVRKGGRVGSIPAENFNPAIHELVE